MEEFPRIVLAFTSVGRRLVPEIAPHPHNNIIESLMISGILGGLPFIGVVLVGLWRAFKICRQLPHLSWLGVLLVHYFIAGLFSFSLMNSTFFWFSLAAVFGVSPAVERAGRRAIVRA